MADKAATQEKWKLDAICRMRQDIEFSSFVQAIRMKCGDMGEVEVLAWIDEQWYDRAFNLASSAGGARDDEQPLQVAGVQVLVEMMAGQQQRLGDVLYRLQQFVNCPSPDATTRLKLAMNEYAGAYDAVIAAKAALEE